MSTFIETQFPIARLSAESYKERKAGASQTLTGLGKWWGRKPLILVRASILGMLMPASNNPKKDRDIFLKILTMDDAGAWERCKPAVHRKTTRAAFDALPYAERIGECERPENVEGPSDKSWTEINGHLGTTAKSLAELVEQLGQRTFGHTPRVGDSFCGGGSIPFEAARIGCEAFGSDLNPVAGLLTWASLNLLGGGKAVQDEVRMVQETVFAAAEKQITKWGIEHNEHGERAEAFLYCVEVKPEGCDYYIPLAPSWVISEKYRIVATWKKMDGSDRLQPTVVAVSESELKLYKQKKGATVGDSRVLDPFDAGRSWSVEALRGPEGLRRWSNDDVVPRPGDVFQERLYCIRWVNEKGERRYAAPDAADLARETKVLKLLRERFADWQREGFIPSKAIPEGGVKTEEPIRTRGWTHWHHLFTPRQLLAYGTYLEASRSISLLQVRIAILLKLGVQANWNSRLCIWNADKSKGPGSTEQTFANQALNTLFNFGNRSYWLLRESLLKEFICGNTPAVRGSATVADARDLQQSCDLWITDPPYADAVNYHELGDFFLAWYDKQILKNFKNWIPDARAVWADLGMILWAAGLKATAAWTISTETSAGIKKGNYVQGTVCLVLRKRMGNEPGFLDEVYPLVEDEVKRQIASMQALDEGGEPNFNDADYQLAAYAAALKVLTQYGNLDGKDVEHEVFAVRAKNERSDFQIVIERALLLACDYLIPKGLDQIWRKLALVERYYLRSLDIESRGERRQGMYEELARGFGVTDIKALLKSDKANGARMQTGSELGKTVLADADISSSGGGNLRRGRAATKGPHPFASTDLRHLLFAIRETAGADNSTEPGRQYLRDSLGDKYWQKRDHMVALLDWLARLANAEPMISWADDSQAAR